MTRIIKIDPLNPEQDKIIQAAQVIKRGGLVVFPTETVYGIAANLSDKRALERLSKIKQRPKDKAFTVHIDSKEKLDLYATEIPTAAYKLIDKFWPGPLTLILKSREGNTVGLRLPDCEIAIRLIKESGVTLVAPSANLAGEPAPTTVEEAIKDLEGKVDLAVDGGPTKKACESSIVDFTVTPASVLRQGAIKKEDIEKIINTKVVLFVCTGNTCRSVMAKYLFEKALKEMGREDVQVLSAGILMLEGMGATADTLELLRKVNIDASGHSTKRVNLDMIRRSDLILVMEKIHEEEIAKISPDAKKRVFLLKEFAKIEDNNLNIEDPIGRPVDFYWQTFYTIKEAVERVAKIV